MSKCRDNTHAPSTPFALAVDSAPSADSTEQLFSFFDDKLKELNSLKESLGSIAEESTSPLVEAEITTFLLLGLAKTFSAIQDIELAKKGLLEPYDSDDDISTIAREASTSKQANSDETQRFKNTTTFKPFRKDKNKMSSKVNYTPITRFQERVDTYLLKVSKFSASPIEESCDAKTTIVNKIAANRIVKDTLRDRRSNK